MTSKEELLRVTDPLLIDLAGMVRRWVITLTNEVLWQLTGFELPDGNGGTFKEVRQAEVFSGIGFFSRPPRDGSPEAITAAIHGDANALAIVGTRDEATRAKVAGDLAEDETATFNSQSILAHRANGTIEARSADGSAGPLSPHADMQALADVFRRWTPVAGDGGAALKTALMDLLRSWPTGTKVLKGE